MRSCWEEGGHLIQFDWCPYVVVELPIHVQLFVTPWTAACQASLSFTISWSLLKLMSTEAVMPSKHLILCCPLLLLPSVFPSIRFFSNESTVCCSHKKGKSGHRPTRIWKAPCEDEGKDQLTHWEAKGCQTWLANHWTPGERPGTVSLPTLRGNNHS